MELADLPLEPIDWATVPRDGHAGETGMSWWRTREFGAVRLRMVEYSPGFLADHWCEKGHVILCLDGELDVELQDGRVILLRPGVSTQVADHAEPHRVRSAAGATVFIVD